MLRASQSRQLNRLSQQARRIIGCDHVRLNVIDDTTYVIAGALKHTTMSAGQWYDQDGNRKDWWFIEESVVASGTSPRRLLRSCRDYAAGIQGSDWSRSTQR